MARFLSTIILTLGLGGALASCAQLAETTGPVGPFGPETKVWHSSSGFTLTLSHKRYQYVPNLDELMGVCGQSLRLVSDDIAAEKGKDIIPFEDGEVIMKTARDDVMGVSTCKASVSVSYAVTG